MFVSKGNVYKVVVTIKGYKMETIWTTRESQNKDCLEILSSATYHEKLMMVLLDLNDNGIEAYLRAAITSPNGNRENEFEFFSQRYYVSLDKDDFYDKMMERKEFLFLDLEMRAAGKDDFFD